MSHTGQFMKNKAESGECLLDQTMVSKHTIFSLHWFISLPICLFLYNGVYYVVFKLSISDIIVIQQSSNGYRKQQSVLVIVSIILGLSEYK